MESYTAAPSKTILWLTLALTALVLLSGYTGILAPGFYARETFNWQIQSVGQDIVDVFVVAPFLFITGLFAARGNNTAKLLWGGATLYLTYTYVIYCFSLHFNQLFVVYCFTLGIAFYSFLFFLYSQITAAQTIQNHSKTHRFTGYYFIVLPFVFYMLWLKDIIPAIATNSIPAGLQETGLFTNPVHIIDLSVFLPGLFITGLFLLRKKVLAGILAPVFLSFFILMDITIGFLAALMKQNDLAADFSVTIAMGVLAVFSLVILIKYLQTGSKKFVPATTKMV